jgi:hypothetical protein
MVENEDLSVTPLGMKIVMPYRTVQNGACQ